MRVEIPQITRDFNGEELPIVALMKRGIMEWFNDLEPLALNSSRLQGEFDDNTTDEPDQSNAGANFFRRIGGFRTDSYTLTKLGKFSITEYYFDSNGEWTSEANEFKSITFGLPGGVSVREIIEFLRVQIPSDQRDQMRRLKTPAGVSYNLDINWDEADTAIGGSGGAT